MRFKYNFSSCLLCTFFFSLTIGLKTWVVEASSIPANFSVIHHKQKVDHFSFANSETFDQRIIISKDVWGGNGSPIFFYCGNEGDIFMFANNTGFMWENSKQFRAMIVFAEHRYYGTSLPYGNDSFSSLPKLGYLTTEQALADFAYNIELLKKDYKATESPVILFGGSYGGMLAAWFRIKYPHLSSGAVAASAPILQFPGIYNCSDYMTRATKNFEEYSELCPRNIRNSWPILRSKAKSADGRRWLNRLFNICPADELREENDIETLINYIMAAYDSMAMTDYPNPADFLRPLPAFPIKEACKFLSSEPENDDALLTNIYSAISIFYNYTQAVPCTSFAPDEMDRGWSVQACTEMVMPICANGVTDMFEPTPFDLDAYSEACNKKYAVKPDPSLAVRVWGGRDSLSTATNIIFSNGDRDPWSIGGVNDGMGIKLNPTIHIINIPHACHHEDLRETGKNDPQPVIDARKRELKIIRGWIRQHHRKLRRFNAIE